MNNKVENKKKWHDNKTTIVLLLIFLHPIGLLGLWLRKKTKMWKKIIVSIPMAFILFFIILAILLPPINYYEYAIEDIKKKDYISAYNNLSQVEQTDGNYQKSHIKKQEIDSLARHQANTILDTIVNNYEQINQMILVKDFTNAKKTSRKVIELYEKIKLIIPQTSNNKILENVRIIRKIKKKKVEQNIDSINSQTFISNTLGDLSDIQFEKLQKDSLNLTIFNNLALNHILLLKLKENSSFRDKYLNDKLLKTANGDLNEYIKLQIGKLSDKQYNELKNKTLDTLIIKDKSLNSLLLSKMENNTELRQVYFKELAVKKENAKFTARKENIIRQFSAWDGSHTLLKKYIKENMNSPRSFDHVKTTYSDHGSYLLIKMKFRGKNSFGATVLNIAECRAKIDGSKIYNIRIY